jgi:KDO2-lipid IV(A) lauroyltransferase
VRIAERVAYWTVAAPVLAVLPAALGYRVACWRGDWLFRTEPAKRTDLTSNLRLLLGDEFSGDVAQAAVRDWFRLASCEALDVRRLRGNARPLRRLVEIRGREHLEAALAGGKGALLCSGHFGSFDSGFSMLGASGFKVTTIGRWQHKYTVGLSGAERRFWNMVYTKPLERLRYRPNIEPWVGRVEVAAKAAAALRANEVVTISIDVPPLDGDRARAVEVPFLGGRATLLPGVVTLAKLTGAPVLMCFLFRSPDYRHQVLHISAPVPVHGETATAFGRCAAEVSAAVRTSPAHWQYLASTADLADLGLIPQVRDGPAAATSKVGTAPGLRPLSP